MKMKSVLLVVLIMATNVVAFKQIFAINAGGEAHTDSDGIVYQRGVDKHTRSVFNFDPGNIPDKDKLIYHNFEYSIKPDQLQYDLPLNTDGLYLLIAKFATDGNTKETDMTLNGKIKLLSNVNLFELCGDYKTCDIYFYFCITDGTLYYQNQSTLLQNEIHIEIRPIKSQIYLSGLVLLEGTMGESQKLVSSNTNELLDFDQTKFYQRCWRMSDEYRFYKEQEHTKNHLLSIMKNSSENYVKNNTNSSTVSYSSLTSIQNVISSFQNIVEKLQMQHFENSNLFQNYVVNLCETKLQNATEMPNQQFLKILTEIMATIERTDKANNKYERLQSEMTTKIDEINTNYKKLQADAQQRAEIQKKSDEKQLKVQSAMKTSIEQSQESGNQNFIQQMRSYDQSTERIELKIEKLHNQSTETNIKTEKLQLEFATNTNQTNKNFEKLQADVKQLAEIQQKSDEKQAAMKTSIEQSQESSNQNFIQQMRVHNQSTEQLNIKIETLQLDFATRTDKTNKYFDKLQTDVQQLAEIQQKSDEKQAAMKTSIEQSQESSNQNFIQQMRFHNQSTEQLNIKIDKTNKNFEKLQADVQQLAEIQRKSDEKQAAMKTSIERNQESSNQIFIQQMHIHNSQMELTSKSNQANKNIEVLQVSVQQIVEDNKKMRAEIKQMNLEVQDVQGNLKSAILEITKQLSVISDVVMTIEERQK
jgi:hypothetical protein